MDDKSQVKVTGYWNKGYTDENTNEFIGGHAKITCIDLETTEGNVSIPLESPAGTDVKMKMKSDDSMVYGTRNGNIENTEEAIATEKKPGVDIITETISINVSLEDVIGRKDQNEESENTALDGGWGYLVIAGCFIIANICNIIGPCFGILFSSFLLDLGTSSTAVSWIFNMQALMFGLSNLIVAPLAEHYGWRLVVIAGGILCFLSLASSAFATSATFLFFSYSILGGFGTGMSTLIAYVILPYYFKRLRGRANAILMGGVSSAQLIGPPLITFLQQAYGFRGATLIVAALSLNICVAGSVFHPVEWHSKAPNRCNKTSKSRTSSGVCAALFEVICSIGRNFKILKLYRARIISLGSCFFMSGYLNFFMLVPFVMEAGGYTQETASWCMSVSAACNLASRMVVSSLTDLPRFNMRASFMAGTLVISVTIAGMLVFSAAANIPLPQLSSIRNDQIILLVTV
nr:monocarboxylate transporter 13-like [Procambarus clarkii]